LVIGSCITTSTIGFFTLITNYQLPITNYLHLWNHMMPSPNPAYTDSVRKLMELFGKLPGIGARSAERMAFHILKSTPAEALALADAIRHVKEHVKHCSICFNLTETDPCAICTDPARDAATICVVEQPKDLLQLESTGVYRGVYHVLLGHLAPLENIGPGELTITGLVERITKSQVAATPVREVILATNPTMDGDGTALYIQEQLMPLCINVTRLARGLPAGAQIEYSNKAILADAIAGRTKA
jgi:recombination protein RecR